MQHWELVKLLSILESLDITHDRTDHVEESYRDGFEHLTNLTRLTSLKVHLDYNCALMLRVYLHIPTKTSPELSMTASLASLYWRPLSLELL